LAQLYRHCLEHAGTSACRSGVFAALKPKKTSSPKTSVGQEISEKISPSALAYHE
jgi:hypothetical protein